MLAEAAAGRLETLATELEQFLASDQPTEEVVARWRGLRRVPTSCASTHRPAAAANDSSTRSRHSKKRLLYQQARAKVEQDHLRRFQQICRQVETLAGSEQITLKAGDRALRDPVGDRRACAAAVETGSAGHPGASRSRARRPGAARAGVARRRRVAALGEPAGSREICRGMEALKAEENLEVAGRRMRELQARWKPVALAPRAQGEVMWRRFKAAQDEVFARTSAHFAAQNQERAGNLARKQTLCERAEALADSTDWVKTPPRYRRCRPNGRASVRLRADMRRPSGSASVPRAIGSSRDARRI